MSNTHIGSITCYEVRDEENADSKNKRENAYYVRLFLQNRWYISEFNLKASSWKQAWQSLCKSTYKQYKSIPAKNEVLTWTKKRGLKSQQKFKCLGQNGVEKLHNLFKQ